MSQTVRLEEDQFLALLAMLAFALKPHYNEQEAIDVAQRLRAAFPAPVEDMEESPGLPPYHTVVSKS